MSFDLKKLVTAVGGLIAPQFFNKSTDQYEVQEGSNGASHVKMTGSNIAYDSADDMFKIKSLQKKFRDSFTGATLDNTKWDSALGTGGAITIGSGQLTIGSGTTINAETSILSKELFTIPLRLSIGFTLSQRIANQSFLVELVSIDSQTGLPDNKNICALLFDGTSATQGKYRVQNGGLSPLDSGLVTLPTTSSNSVYEIEPFADECWFHGGVLDSTNARSNSYRRHQQIPDPNALYKIRIRWLNGSTAPASNTNAVIQYVAAQDYAELTAEITAGRGQSVAGQALGVQVAGGSVSISGTATVSVSGTATIGGAAAHDAPVSGNPVRVAGKSTNANPPTAVSATGEVADVLTTMNGLLLVRPFSNPEAEWQTALSAVTVNTDTVLKAAAAAGIRNYITAIQLKNTSATATEIIIKDGAAVIWRGFLPANMVNADVINFSTPLKSSAATAFNIQCVTAANVYISAQGHIAP